MEVIKFTKLNVMKSTDEPIIVSQKFNTSIDKVWCAITELDQMKHWFQWLPKAFRMTFLNSLKKMVLTVGIILFENL